MDECTRNDVIDNVISQSGSLNTMKPVPAYDDSDQLKPEVVTKIEHASSSHLKYVKRCLSSPVSGYCMLLRSLLVMHY